MLLFLQLDYTQLLIGFALGFLAALTLFYLFSRLFQRPYNRYDRYHRGAHGRSYDDYHDYHDDRPPHQNGIGCLLFLGLISIVGVGAYQLSQQGGSEGTQNQNPASMSLVPILPDAKPNNTHTAAPKEEATPNLGLNKDIYAPDNTYPSIKEVVPKRGQYFLAKNHFPQKANAESACRGLQNLDLPVCIIRRHGQYAACAGPYPTREEAESVGRRWKKGWEVFEGE